MTPGVATVFGVVFLIGVSAGIAAEQGEDVAYGAIILVAITTIASIGAWLW